jgi:enterochelin esterase-like enzyme
LDQSGEVVKRWWIIILFLVLLFFLGLWIPRQIQKYFLNDAGNRAVYSSQENTLVPSISPSPYTQELSTVMPSATSTTVLVMSATITVENTPTPTPTLLSCWHEGGRIELKQLQTELLPLPLEFRVYLPPCYDQQLDRRYPVLYLIHGSNYNDDQWDRLGADETADLLIAAGDIPPFIIVMPRDRVWTQPDEDKFGDAMLQSLIPWIDTTYRTLPDRAHRAIGGLSRGGAWAVHLGLSHWELFGAIGAHSLAVFDTDAPYNINRWLDALPPDSLPRIYLDIGDHDREIIFKSAVWFETILTEKGIPHEWHLNVGKHDETYWQAHVEEYLKWYAQDW